MNRWLLPTASVLVAAGVGVAGSLIAPDVVPRVEVPTVTTRSTLLCPAFDSATATRSVIAASTTAELKLTKLSTQQNPQTGKDLVQLSQPSEPIRVSAERTGAVGASTVVTASDGSDRGLSLAGCLLPQPDYWFAGVAVSADSGSELDLVNLDDTRAVIDVTAFGPAGRLTAPRGIVVDPNSEKTVSLALIPRSEQPISIRVTSSEGRVAAFLRQRSWGAARPLGADWMSAAVAPTTDVIVPGVPDGAGRRTLVIANPGDRTAIVKVDVLGDSGPTNVVGADTVEVLAGTSKAVDLSAGLGGAAAGLHLTADQPVTAGLLADSGGSQSQVDPVGVGAAQPLPTEGIWPVALGSASAVVAFTNPDPAPVNVTVSVGSGAGAGQETTVKVPAQSTVTYSLPKSARLAVRIRTDATTLRAALIARQNLGKVKGLAVLPLTAAQGRTESVAVSYDPHLGS